MVFVPAGSEQERELLILAGGEMAIRGANHKALAYFGLEWMTRNDWKGSLKCEGLPVITSPTGEELEENNHLISSLFPRAVPCLQKTCS